MTLSSALPYLKAVFFDLDDVLVFSEKLHNHAWHVCLPSFGVNPTTIDFASFTGMSDMQQAKRFVSEFSINQEPQALWESKRLTFLELAKAGFESAQGRNALLERLSKIYKIGVVSSSPITVIQEVLRLERILNLFHFVIGFEDCEQHKPHPEPYQNALKLTGISAHEALVIEDSVTGITAAKNANIPVIGLLKDQRPEQILKDVSYYNNFSEIHDSLFQ
ncbi:MAG: HAD family hydrolase [Candidatus Berkiella sp.]